MIFKLKPYIHLMRLNKPIGIFLLLWPTLWALWLASNNKPHFFIVIIFILGVIIMRSAGCIINDFADQHFDSHVKRTQARPLASGQLKSSSALLLFFILMFLALSLVLLLNSFTVLLAFVGALLAVIYPFLKRITHLPQIGLGFAFAWGVPMAFAAQLNFIPPTAWVIFAAAVVWPIIYDTFYAMVDREDDKKIGVKSTAILFGNQTQLITGFLQIIFLMLLVAIGYLFKLHWIYDLSLIGVGILFLYQQHLIKNNDRDQCFKAFLNNHWVGLIIFLSIILGAQ